MLIPLLAAVIVHFIPPSAVGAGQEARTDADVPGVRYLLDEVVLSSTQAFCVEVVGVPDTSERLMYHECMPGGRWVLKSRDAGRTAMTGGPGRFYAVRITKPVGPSYPQAVVRAEGSDGGPMVVQAPPVLDPPLVVWVEATVSFPAPSTKRSNVRLSPAEVPK